MISISHLFISPDHNFFGHHGKPAGEHPSQECNEIECVAGKGIKGDRFFDYKENYKGQITFFSWEIYQSLCRKLDILHLLPSAFRRNVMTKGVDLNSLVGRKFQIQGIEFEGVEECKPCYWMNEAVHSHAEAAMKGNGGLRARILSSGTLKKTLPLPPLSVGLLSGGKSSRMGRDKATIEINGKTLWKHQLQTLMVLPASERFISGCNDSDCSQSRLPIIKDTSCVEGPLSGIASLLEKTTAPLLLVLAIDMPIMTSHYLQYLFEQCSEGCGVVPYKEGFYEGLSAIYPKKALPLAQEVLIESDHSMQNFIKKCIAQNLLKPIEVASCDFSLFKNFNTPEDFIS